MAKAWRNQRSDLHVYFKDIGGEEDAIKLKSERLANLGCQED